MTSERRLLFGLDDLRAITLECCVCKTRVTVAPEKIVERILFQCPNCQTEWLNPRDGVMAQNYASDTVRLLMNLRRLIEQQGNSDSKLHVRILFEFEQPKT